MEVQLSAFPKTYLVWHGDGYRLQSADDPVLILLMEKFGWRENLESPGTGAGTGKVSDSIAGVKLTFGHNLTKRQHRVSGESVIRLRIIDGVDTVAEREPTLHIEVMADSESRVLPPERSYKASRHSAVGIGEYGFGAKFIL